MATIRCDRCATRLEPTQENCPKCGATNSDYSLPVARPPLRRRVVLAVVLFAALAGVGFLALRFLPLGLLNRMPAHSMVWSARKNVFGEKALVADTVAAYMAAWKAGNVSSMKLHRLPGTAGIEQDATYQRYPLTLYSYRVRETVVDESRAYALVTAVVPNLREVVRTVATISNPNASLPKAMAAALAGASHENVCWMVKLGRLGSEWKILEGFDPSIDEYLGPIVKVLSAGETVPRAPKTWETMVRAKSPSPGRNRLGAVTLNGVVENISEQDLGPLEIIATFYDAEGIPVGQAVERRPELPPNRSLPFQCVVVENPSTPVERYSLVVRSLY